MTAEALARPLGEPTRRDWIAVLSAMLGAFMAVLDIQITNSSLKDIQGALAATLEEGSWISTSYLVAEIIMIPMTAWLVQLLSARRLAVMISVGFLVSSLLCSFAWNLESMIVFRAMQGFTGGALIPLAFTLALVKLPEHHRPKGMALFAITATFAPSIGPTLGGWLTENFGWEYIFYINVPPGLLMIAGLLYGLEKKAPHWELLKSTDYAGIVTLGIGLLISARTRNQFLASQVAILSSFLPALMLSGFLFDLRNVPTFIRLVGSILPATYFMELVKTLFLAGDNWHLALKNLLILAGYAVFLLNAARLCTRKKLD